MTLITRGMGAIIRGGKKRKLGTLAGKPEPWYERGGYKQVHFPKADYVYGKGEDEQYSVRKKAYINKIDKQFEAEFEKWEDWVADEDYETQNTIKESGYKKAMKNAYKNGNKKEGELNHLKQYTMKILLNSLYGATALPSFRYGSVILSEAITLSGQRIIQESALFANTHMNKVLRNELKLEL